MFVNFHKYDRVLNLNWNAIMNIQSSEYSRNPSRPGFCIYTYTRVVQLRKVLNMPEYDWIMPYGSVLDIPGQPFTGFQIIHRS